MIMSTWHRKPTMLVLSVNGNKHYTVWVCRNNYGRPGWLLRMSSKDKSDDTSMVYRDKLDAIEAADLMAQALDSL